MRSNCLVLWRKFRSSVSVTEDMIATANSGPWPHKCFCVKIIVVRNTILSFFVRFLSPLLYLIILAMFTLTNNCEMAFFLLVPFQLRFAIRMLKSTYKITLLSAMQHQSKNVFSPLQNSPPSSTISSTISWARLSCTWPSTMPRRSSGRPPSTVCASW